MKKIVVIDNLRSVYNVGSIFRTANALGVEEIYLCGTTPTPLDKRGHKRKDFAKVALGAEDRVVWHYRENTEELLQVLHNDGVYIVAIEQGNEAVDYKKIDITGKDSVALLIGNEVGGVSKEALLQADILAEIPMLGSKESLNVTIAFGVAGYRILGV